MSAISRDAHLGISMLGGLRLSSFRPSDELGGERTCLNEARLAAMISRAGGKRSVQLF